MAYTVKWFSEFDDTDGVKYITEVYDRDFSGSAIEVLSGSEPFRAEMMDVEDPFQVIRSMKFTFQWVSDTTSGFDISDVFITDDRKYKLVFSSVDEEGNKTPIYYGFLVFVDCDEPFNSKPYPVTLSATCGLPFTRDDYFLDSTGSFVEGNVSLIKVIANALTSTQLTLPIYTYVNLFESSMPQDTVSPLELAEIDADGLRGKKASEIIEGILNAFGAFIVQAQGAWIIKSVKDQTIYIGTVRRYDTNGDFIDTADVRQTASFGRSAFNSLTPNVRPLNGVTERFAEPNSIITETVSPGNAVNRLPNGTFSGPVLSGNMSGWVDDFSALQHPSGPGWTRAGTGKPDDPYRVEITGADTYGSTGVPSNIHIPSPIILNAGDFDVNKETKLKLVISGAFRAADISFFYLFVRLNDGDRDFVSYLDEGGKWNLSKRDEFYVRIDVDVPANPPNTLDFEEATLQTFEIKSDVITNFLNQGGQMIAKLYFEVRAGFVSTDKTKFHFLNPKLSWEDFSVVVTTETMFEAEHKYRVDAKFPIRNPTASSYSIIVADKVGIETPEQSRISNRVMTGYMTRVGFGSPTDSWKRFTGGEEDPNDPDFEPIQKKSLRERIRLLCGKRRIIEGQFIGHGLRPDHSVFNRYEDTGAPQTFYTITGWKWSVKDAIYDASFYELQFPPLDNEVIDIVSDDEGGRGNRMYGGGGGSKQTGGGGTGKVIEEIVIDEILPYDYNVNEVDAEYRVCDIGVLIQSMHVPDSLECQILIWPDWVTDLMVYRGEELADEDIPIGGILQIQWKGQPDKVGNYQILVELVGEYGEDVLTSIPLIISPKTIQTHTLIDTGIDGPLILGPIPGAYKLPEKWDLRDKIEGLHDKVEQTTKGGGPGGDEIDHTITRDVTETDLATYRPFQDTDGITTLAGQFTHQVKTWRGDKLVSDETINFVLYDDEYLALLKMFLTKAEVEIGEITLDGSTIFVNPEISNNKATVADTEHDEVILELSFDGEIIKTTTITLVDPETDGEYYLYDEDTEYETGVYTLTVTVNNGGVLAQKRTGIFEIGPLEPKPKAGLKLVAFKPGTVNYTILEELPLSGAEYDLPVNYSILFDGMDGIPYFSIEWKYYKLRAGSFAEYDLEAITGYPQKITYSEAVTSEKVLIFGLKNSTQISDAHDAPATFRAVATIRDEEGVIVGICQSDFAFRIALEPGDYSGGLRFLNITGSDVVVVDKNMPKAGRKYPLPPAGTFWSVSVLKFLDELNVAIEFDEVLVKLEKNGVVLHFMGIDFVNRFTSAEPIAELPTDLDANVIGELDGGLRYCDDPANLPVLIDEPGEYKATFVALLEDVEVAELYTDFEIIEEAVEPPVKDCCDCDCDEVTVFKTDIGDGVNKIYDIIHGLGTLDVVSDLRLNSDDSPARGAYKPIDINTLRYEFAKVPTVNRFSVTIRKK